MVSHWFPKIPFWGGIQERILFALLIFYVLYTLFSFWSYRFSVWAVGVREATYSQAITIRLIDVVLTVVMLFLGVLFPWGIPVLLLLRLLLFKFFFKAEWGKALMGVLISMLLAGLFTCLYVVALLVWAWFTKSLPF